MPLTTDDNLSARTPPRFHLLAKPSGSTCNIDCTYCFFLSKESLYPNEKNRMSEATLEAYIRQLLESHPTHLWLIDMSDFVREPLLRLHAKPVMLYFKDPVRIGEGLAELAPRDLRRTCARLCHGAAGELEQIPFLLGHASVQTTER